MNDRKKIIPEMKFLLILHDDDCEGATGNPENCICTPVTHFVSKSDWIQRVKADAKAAKQRTTSFKNSKR